MSTGKKSTSTDGTIRRTIAQLRPHIPGLVGSLALAAAVVVSTLLVPVYSGDAVDCVMGEGSVDMTGLVSALRGLAAAVVVTMASQWLLTALTNRIAASIVRDMRRDAFAKLQVLPLSYIDSHRHGDIVNRVVTDIDQFSNGLTLTFQQLFSGVLTIVLTLVFMFRLNPAVTLVVICVTPVSIFTAKFIATRGYAHFHEQSVRRGELTGAVEEYVGGIPVLETFDAQDVACGHFREVDARLSQASFKAVFYSSLVNPTTRFVNALVYAGVGIFGAFAAIAGSLTVGGLTAFLSYANQYTKPFNDISDVVTELQNSFACAARLYELLDEPEQTPDAPGAVELSNVRGQVELRDVAFSYTPDRPLIEHFSLSVRPGMRVAIVGPTGCGKSTMINLLMRFYDVDAGQILVDGRDVRDITRASLRAAYGMVLQETWVKSATVANNLRLGAPDATDEEVRQAAKAAFAHDFIMRLPHGYDTVLGGDQSSISAGQRQLLCIARAMLANAPMLILDEATSNIDTRTEILVQRAFERLMEGRTSFVVAHRLSTIVGADLIVTMRDGRIVETGTHEQLLAAHGFYASLYESQFS
ncbi:ABC transporter ATP-binding protein [uncultured Parolsenella sp.]|uniref:ABC transporter ATP-binding protein n=1 Tax=uncultured Parolsenella sp. TaxID=2083008 RepID=UPI0025FF0B85|nr:ABC transporter ATP-binding protein [uncultured Parolsenella sp.]